MLKSLSIKNLAVIKDAYIDFEKGLNILTGETGAGKSIVIDSINLIIGDRASKEIIRTGENTARIEGLFYISDSVKEKIENLGIVCEDNELLIVREINLDGKNMIRINGSIVVLSILKEIGSLLINIHGQNENQELLNSEKHIELLDEYAGNGKLLEEYKKIYNEARMLSDTINKSKMSEEEKERKKSLLEYEIECIENVNLKEGEIEELLEKRKIIMNSQKIVDNLNDALSRISRGYNNFSAEELLAVSSKKISEISNYDDALNGLSDRLNDIYYNLIDVSSELSEISSSYGFSEEEINEIENRIDEINNLRRRFGNDYYSIMEYYNKIKEELNNINFSDECILRSEKELAHKKKELKIYSDKLTDSRVKAGNKLEKEIIKELEDLNMKNTTFKVDIKNEEKFLKDGINKVEFLMSANAGIDLGKLTKIASGGEISRIMLAINCALLSTNRIPTMIYDEIDTGVSGRAAQKIAEKLYYVSKNRQVLCVTHLAQIAAMADTHFLIEKNLDKKTTKTSVLKLNREERVDELSRILGGVEITKNTIFSAEEMLNQSCLYKEGKV